MDIITFINTNKYGTTENPIPMQSVGQCYDFLDYLYEQGKITSFIRTGNHFDHEKNIIYDLYNVNINGEKIEWIFNPYSTVNIDDIFMDKELNANIWD